MEEQQRQTTFFAKTFETVGGYGEIK